MNGVLNGEIVQPITHVADVIPMVILVAIFCAGMWLAKRVAGARFMEGQLENISCNDLA